eukprot:TRINITY_DN6759_c0_g1_i2.p1 TRINITY_DN6759_c0_g1~~TRINITY_DN6759_c0_g1_i2.p1  ORF type:complete len:279 (+),score=34.00 TRINITY_DN6759_c0_g1_i2:232-1068(+)
MKHAQQNPNMHDDASRPVTRTFYSHTHAVQCLAFHPGSVVLASGGADHTIQLFDTVKANSKRAIQSLQDTHSVNGVAWHPSGEFLLAGTDHGAPHLYMPSKHSNHCFLPPDEASYHSAAITSVQFSPDGSKYASCSADGAIKLWDGASSALVSEIPAAHDGRAVNSIVFSKDGKKLLSCGNDSLSRLWDVNSSEQVSTYAGAVHHVHPANSCWDESESFVFSHDEGSNSIVGWDCRTEEVLVKKKTDHKHTARCVVASPTERCMMSCSDDYRARFWVF